MRPAHQKPLPHYVYVLLLLLPSFVRYNSILMSLVLFTFFWMVTRLISGKSVKIAFRHRSHRNFFYATVIVSLTNVFAVAYSGITNFSYFFYIKPIVFLSCGILISQYFFSRYYVSEKRLYLLLLFIALVYILENIIYPPYSITKAPGFLLDGRAGGNVYVAMVILVAVLIFPKRRFLAILLAVIYTQTTTLLAVLLRFFKRPGVVIPVTGVAYLLLLILVSTNQLPSPLVFFLNIATSFRLSAGVGFLLTILDIPFWGIGLLEWSFISEKYLKDIATDYNGLQSFHYEFMHFHNSVFEYIVGTGLAGILWLYCLFSIDYTDAPAHKTFKGKRLIYGFTPEERVFLWVILMGSGVGTSAIFILYIGIIMNIKRSLNV
jgi:hypothetical protein